MSFKNFDNKKYDDYVKLFIQKTEELNRVISYDRLKHFNLPDARWFIKNCPDASVKSYSDFVRWCGFVSHKSPPTKEEAIDLIYKMQLNLGRPLKYDDFRGYGCHRVSIGFINKTWGSLNKMKKDLGLEITQENMIDRQLTKNSFDEMIDKICRYVKSENRNFITCYEIDNNKNFRNSNTLRKMAKKYYGVDLRELFLQQNIYLGKQGYGINFDFKDGEHVSSQFEYIFSRYLKKYGLVYNVDYFRDVKYSNFASGVKSNINCDYVITYNNKTVFIEIAGILNEYKSWYYNQQPINNRKSREKYRKKLWEKEQLLKSNNLLYFILFPCDLTNDNIKRIIEDGSLELKKEIEGYNQHNINWKKIRTINFSDLD